MSKNQQTNNMRNLGNHTTLSEEAFKIYLMTPGLNGRAGIPVCIWGKPGGGKSTMGRAWAQSLGMHVETVILSTREPSEVCGAQVPQRDATGEVTISYAKPLWARRVMEKTAEGIPCVVFFDELTTCPPNTQAPALRLINEGNAGDWSMPDSTRFFCAANPPECSAGGQDLTAPMANRMGHFTAAEGNAQDFSDWLQNNGGEKHHLNYINNDDEQAKGLSDYKKLNDKVKAGWDQEFAKARAMVGEFVSRHGDALHKMPDADSADVGRAWASPRTWEAAARLMATARCLEADANVIVHIIGAIIGEAAALEFVTYATSLNLPDLYEILNGRSTFSVSPSAADVAVVVLKGLANLATALNAQDKLSQSQKRNFWIFLTKGSAGDIKDVQLRVLKQVIKKDNTLSDQSIPECLKCLEKLGDISQATAKHKRSS